MTKNWTLTEAFASFGAEARNIRQAWSARSADEQTIVVTLWRDLINDDGKEVSVDCFGDPNLHAWKDTPGNRQRIKDLAWARDHCDGHFRVVFVEASDTKAVPRSTTRRYPDATLVMKLIRLDETTGEFKAQGTRTH